jgi:hypothetical protein
MKKFNILAVMILVAVAACNKENPKENEKAPVSPERRTLTINMSSIQAPESESVSRAAFGTESTGSLPVVWNAGDRIAIVQDKGLGSQKISIYELDGAGGNASGVFTYVSGDASDADGDIKDVIYPASAAETYSIPTAQDYVSGSFDPAAVLMTWHSDTGIGVDGVTLSPEGAVVCLQLTGKSGQSVSSIKVNAGSADYVLTCGSPVSLSDTAVPFYVSVPSCADKDIRFTLTLSDASSVVKASLGKTLEAGKVHRFPAVNAIDRGDLFDGGIVFQTDYVNSWVKIVSLDETTVAFSTEGISLGTEGNPDEGKANTAVIAATPNFATAYPAAKWCTDKGAEWYMPSRKEVANIYNGLLGGSSIGQARAQALLTYYGGDQLQLDTYYQTSCENTATKVWHVKTNSSKTAYGQNKTAARAVRAIKKISI